MTLRLSMYKIILLNLYYTRKYVVNGLRHHICSFSPHLDTKTQTAHPCKIEMWRWKLSCSKWRSFSLVHVAILAAIIFISSMKTSNLRPWKHGILSPLFGITKKSLHGCECWMEPWPDDKKTAAHLLLSVPGLNVTTYKNLQKRHPNLPLDLLYSRQDNYCSLLPTIFSIEWGNTYWQQATLDPSASVLLYSAFFNHEADGNASIRILGVSRDKVPPLTWCNLWFNSEDPPLPVKTSTIDYLDDQSNRNSQQIPFLLTCPLPPHTKDVPAAVSLTQQSCGEATNLLRVVNGRDQATQVSAIREKSNNTTVITEKKLVPAVCGPALNYFHLDFSSRLVEWLELLRAQGFDRVFLYVTDVHPNITKVLNYYIQESFVQITDYTYPPPYINEPSLRRLWTLVEKEKVFTQEKIYFTDCVLRHMHQYRFLAHFDYDEMPILPRHDKITDLLNELLKNTEVNHSQGFRLGMQAFYDNLESNESSANLPSYLWMLRHNQREFVPSSQEQGQFKPIIDTDVIRGVFSHGSPLCVSKRCLNSELQEVSLDMGYCGYFGRTCNERCKKDAVYDVTLLKHREEVLYRVMKVLSTLDLLHET